MASTLDLRDFSDRLSPMVVKELRHGLRARMFTSILIGTHVLLIVLMSGAMLGVPQEMVHGMFWGGAALAFLLFMPLRGAGALTQESQDGTLDMLILTSISSTRIVRGKWAALMGQSLLLAASLLPYMVARYQWGGVEIVSELVALLALLLGSALITAAVVAFSSQRSLILRIFLGLAMMWPAWGVGMFVVMLAIEKSFSDSLFRELSLLPFWQQVMLIAGIIATMLYAVWLFLALGASRIAPPSENHSTRKRLVYLAFTLFITALGWYVCLAIDDEAILWCIFPGAFLTILAGIDMMTEDLPRFPTVMMPFVEKPLLAPFPRLLAPGWASGVLLYAVLSGLVWSMTISYVVQNKYADEMCSIFALLLTAAVVPVCIRLNKKNAFANWWAVQWALVAAGALLSIFGAVTGGAGIGILSIFIPTTAFFGAAASSGSFDEMLAAGAVIGFFWLLAAVIYGLSSGDDTYRSLLAEAKLLHEQEKRSDPS
ncbi:MAG: hypothetical protein HS117_01265 [Verrucomicrobiaceae bacterium]|nr:hypothetical protein [Verrucomicrobiaceae bacterium]